eukprot:Protomagalhaensia_sp_Gyna_25__2443@NODE_2361_length_1130_cov_21_591201_g1956_i0_p2_GENE_NODE_2361_length_1130_cov_21_591201_g1956_i0NODE_2361_length_1130_cov_21_591201_g1956_i0_p2_ORF_typecomplete_len115_score17_56Ferritin_2/PF13668_6/0_00071_NODE_2361_length_1130_cov_21_591201_g1956_i07601104
MKLAFAVAVFFANAHEEMDALMGVQTETVISKVTLPEYWDYATAYQTQSLCNLQCTPPIDAMVTDFDRMNVAVNLELIEHSLFNHGIQSFSTVDWVLAGLSVSVKQTKRMQFLL